jgi:hypothetical protein
VIALPFNMICTVITGFRAAWHSGWGGDGGVRIVVGLTAGLAGVVLLITPFAVEDVPGTLNHLRWAYTPVRYGMCFLSLAVICLALTLDMLAHWMQLTTSMRPSLGVAARHLPAAGLVVATAYRLTCQHQMVDLWDLTDAVLITGHVLLFGWVCYLLWRLAGRLRPALIVLASAALTIGCATAIGSLSRGWHTGYRAFYGNLFNTPIIQEPETAMPVGGQVCVLDYRSFPFFGSARQYRVCQPPRIPSPAWASSYFQAEQVSLVAFNVDVDCSTRGWRACATWLEENPDVFIPVTVSSGQFALYRVDLEALRHLPPERAGPVFLPTINLTEP